MVPLWICFRATLQKMAMNFFKKCYCLKFLFADREVRKTEKKCAKMYEKEKSNISTETRGWGEELGVVAKEEEQGCLGRGQGREVDGN